MANSQEDKNPERDILTRFWNWAINLRFYLRRWVYHKYVGPMFGPLILFFLLIFYIYLFISFFYLFVIKWGIPQLPSSSIALILLAYSVVKIFLVKYWIPIFVLGIIFSYVIHLTRLYKLPRNRSKKICIGIAFSLDFVAQEDVADVLIKRKQIKRELYKILDENNLTRNFKIKIFNDFQANRIHKKTNFGSEFNSKLLRKTRTPFIIYGFAKKAGYSSRLQYKYDVNYIVSHSPIPWLQSLRLSRDFTKLLKGQNWLFPTSDAGTMIEVVADNIRQDAMFAIGASAAISGSPSIGKIFLDELSVMPHLQPVFLIKIREYQSACFYFLSAIDLGAGNIVDAIDHLENAIRLKNNSYDYYLNLSYLRYLNNEIDKGLQAVDLAQKYASNSAWRFNKAFLLMCKGSTVDIGNAISIYRSLNQNKLSQISANLYAEIIRTLEEGVSENKPQLLYGLVFIYAKTKKDRKKAAGYLQLLEEKFPTGHSNRFLVDDAKKLLL